VWFKIPLRLGTLTEPYEKLCSKFFLDGKAFFIYLDGNQNRQHRAAWEKLGYLFSINLMSGYGDGKDKAHCVGNKTIATAFLHCRCVR
jgi:hypothetical protein